MKIFIFAILISLFTMQNASATSAHCEAKDYLSGESFEIDSALDHGEEFWKTSKNYVFNVMVDYAGDQKYQIRLFTIFSTKYKALATAYLPGDLATISVGTGDTIAADISCEIKR
jgi:hypothetical protein